MTHHGGYHQRRQDPGWLSLRNLALTLTELPSEGYTAYLENKGIELNLNARLGKKKKCMLVLVLRVPARGVLAALLCARGSSGLEPEDVDGPGLLSIATSDTWEYTRLAI